MSNIEATRQLIKRYGLVGPDELEDALRSCPEGKHPVTYLKELGHINDRQEAMLLMRLEADDRRKETAPVQDGKEVPKPDETEEDEEELVPIDPEELRKQLLDRPTPSRKRPRRRPRREKPLAEIPVPEPEEIVEVEPLPDAEELRGKPLGEILLALKLVHRDDVEDAIDEQKELRGTSNDMQLGEILYQKGKLSRKEVLQALRMQGRDILECNTCGMVFCSSEDRAMAIPDCHNCGGRLFSKSDDDIAQDALPISDVIPVTSVSLVGGSYKDFTVKRLYTANRAYSTYIGEQESLGRKVGILALNLDFARTQADKTLFQQSARNAAKLTHHSVCAAIDIGSIDDSPCYIFEYPDGHSVEEYVFRKGGFAPKIAARIAFQVGLAMKFGHGHGYCSGQIDPARVFVASGVTVKVYGLGFNYAYVDKSRYGFPLGNPAFAAPELFAGAPVDERSDQYALGALLYYLLAAKPPLRGKTWPELAAKSFYVEPQPIETIVEDIDSKLRDLLTKLLQKPPHLRFESFDKMLNSLAPHAGLVYEIPEELGIDDVEIPTPIAAPRRSKFRRRR
ncbi:MAG: hypothetical protein Kow00107_10950 [Planctomycetota bacterium]